jgi:autotransporter adhesin
VSQLQSINAQNVKNFNDLRNDVNGLAKKAYAGIAAAMAMESAPFLPGKTTYAAGTGYYQGQAAAGVTLRRTSDNGRWSITTGISGSGAGIAMRAGVSGVFD